MAIVLGKDGSAPPFGTNIINATYTEECEVVDVTNRDNEGGAQGVAGYRAYMAGFTTKTWEIECHDATGLITSLTSNSTGFQVMNVTENVSIDGAVTFTITCREL
jgi:hypothetical protein